MNVYKIRLKGTNLFYQNVRGRFKGEQTNLGPSGKLYQTKPTIPTYCRISDSQAEKHPHIKVKSPPYQRGQKEVNKPEFELVEYKLKEEGNE